MFDLKFTSKNPKKSGREDPASLADEESALAALEAKVAARLSGLSRREEETFGKLEARRQELQSLTRSRAGGLAAELLGRDAVRFTPGGAPVPEHERALAARRAAVEARMAAADAEQQEAERREEALARAEMAVLKLEKSAQQVRARAQAIEAAERAARPVPAPAAVQAAAVQAPAAARPAPKPDERRKSPRVAMTAEVNLSSDSNFYSGFASDLSDGGLFIATCNLLERGTEVDVTFSLPTGPKITARGVVRWTREYNDATPDVFPGVGLEFVRMSEDHQRAVHAFVAQREPMFWAS